MTTKIRHKLKNMTVRKIKYFLKYYCYNKTNILQIDHQENINIQKYKKLEKK